MLAEGSPERPAAKAPGRLSEALRRLLMKRATIVANDILADRFRLITIEGAALKDVGWAPGNKVQIAMGSGFATRTYTPFAWNGAAGRFCVLGYAHGDGPGSDWVRTVSPGDGCDVFGPRASLDMRQMAGSIAVIGDETSIGLACALTQGDRTAACLFEVDDRANAGQALATLGLGNAALFERRGQDAHRAEMEAALDSLVAAGASFVLSGKAGTIQHLRQVLKRHAVPPRRIAAKAYWAPGKTGLD